MKPIFVRQARKGDEVKAAAWTVQNLDRNKLDPVVLAYPSTFALAAYDEDGPVMFLPVQIPFMLESVCKDPEASDLKQAAALKELVQALVTQCHIQGRGEIYFIGSDEKTSAFAENNIFEKIDAPVYRVKISNLEKKI